MISAGRMIHRVDIEKPVRSENETGESVITGWVKVIRDVPCRVNEQTSIEVYRARQVQADASHLVEMRWTTLLKPSWRLRWLRPDGDRFLNVLGSINPDGRRAVLHVSCREDKPDA